MTIAVTGATGALGRLVVADLARRVPADQIVAVVRDAAKAADLGLTELGVTVREATYEDADALGAAFAGVDRLLFVSGSENGRRIPQHRNVVDAALAAGVEHVFYTSAPRATDTTLALAPEHKATEEMITASGLTWTMLRNNWYSENFAGTVPVARATGHLYGAAGDGRVASAARADYAAGAAVALTTDGHENKVYELGGDTAWTYADLAAALGTAVERPVDYVDLSPTDLDAHLAGAGVDDGTRGFLVTLDENIAEGTLADVTWELSTLIGRPTTPLLDTLVTLARD